MNSYTHPLNAKGPTYIGSRLVYPGETVVTDAPVAGEASDTPDTSDPSGTRDLATLLGFSIKKIEDVLPHLSLDELAALTVLEQGSPNPRQTLIEKIGAETLKRNAAKG